MGLDGLGMTERETSSEDGRAEGEEEEGGEGRARGVVECEVRFYGGIARDTGTERVLVSITGGTLGELLTELGRRWPVLRERLSDPAAGFLVFVLNGRALEPPEPTLRLKSGDVLSIMPFVAGG